MKGSTVIACVGFIALLLLVAAFMLDATYQAVARDCDAMGQTRYKTTLIECKVVKR